MPKFMLWLHPLFQASVTALAVYVASLGVTRLRVNHFGHKLVFPWKRHVRLGSLAYLLWTLGLAGGLIVTWLRFGRPFLFDDHYAPALVLLCAMAAGYATGLRMDRNKGKSKVLPLVHAGANLVVLIEAADLLVTGADILFSLPD